MKPQHKETVEHCWIVYVYCWYCGDSTPHTVSESGDGYEIETCQVCGQETVIRRKEPTT